MRSTFRTNRGSTGRGVRRLRSLRRMMRRLGLHGCSADLRDGTILLSGRAGNWESRTAAGFAAVRCGFRYVVNDIVVPGRDEDAMVLPLEQGSRLEGRFFDVVVVGAGVIGSAVAREAAAYDLSVLVVEKEDDVAVHTSSRNDGMIHPGFAPKPGTLKAHYNARGNRMYTNAAEELGFTLKRTGSIILFDRWWYRLLMPVFRRRCRRNGVGGDYRYLSRNEVRRMEPHVTERQFGGLFLPSAGIVNPFEVTIAYAEDAAARGAEFSFSTAVTGMTLNSAGAIATVETTQGTVGAGVVVNAAGNWADVVAAMADDRFFSLHPRRGVVMILDKRLAAAQNHILSRPDIFRSQQQHSKGGGLIPCIEGNMLAGPTAVETHAREDYGTTAAELRDLSHQLSLNDRIQRDDIITYFAGVRPATWHEDFIVERSKRRRNVVHVAGIQSPGLASAPAIAVDVASMVVDALGEARPVDRRSTPLPRRRRRIDPADLPLDQRAALIRSDPAYGRIVCRCEEVSEGEVRDALRSPLHPHSVDAVKRRTRAGAGRCHGGFCLPRLLEIIHDETGIPIEEIRKRGGDSRVIGAQTKQEREVTHERSAQ